MHESEIVIEEKKQIDSKINLDSFLNEVESTILKNQD